MTVFKEEILQGIPSQLPPLPAYDISVSHAPKRKNILSADEKRLAVRNALRYFVPEHHSLLAEEFASELEQYGRIYMYRFRPLYPIYARPIDAYPAHCKQAAAIMMMIQNNLDPAVAQHPHELITYGGNGAVFQNWAQYLLTMRYLAEMTDEQTLVMYSGHPLGLFPSHSEAPRVVVTNGMMIPNYSRKDDYERYNALGVTQYGQMTAGSYMYIGPQGIVHGTTITILNAVRKIDSGCGCGCEQSAVGQAHNDAYGAGNECRAGVKSNTSNECKTDSESRAGSESNTDNECKTDSESRAGVKSNTSSESNTDNECKTDSESRAGVKSNTSNECNTDNKSRADSKSKAGSKLFITCGLGGMSGAQPKASNIAGVISITAEINPAATKKRHKQGWVDEVYSSLDKLFERALSLQQESKAVSLAYQGNAVDLWEYAAAQGIEVNLGSDQSSLHNPYSGGYYPVGLSFEEANVIMATDPAAFKEQVQNSLRRQVAAINTLAERGMYFFDYGNAFLLESSRANADIMREDGSFRYPSYVQDIMGPMCFDYGFGPFRWVCASGLQQDLDITDNIAVDVLRKLSAESPAEIAQIMQDNIKWIEGAKANNLVVGSQARILYADAYGRIAIARKFNEAIRNNLLSAPVILGRDHHDVSGTDSPFRETSNIYDGSQFTADMAVQNCIGDSFRGATWVSLHNGGGVGWGEVINGGFGMLLDGSAKADKRLESMLFWDVNNGISRRAWARNPHAISAIKRAMHDNPNLKVTLPYEYN